MSHYYEQEADNYHSKQGILMTDQTGGWGIVMKPSLEGIYLTSFKFDRDIFVNFRTSEPCLTIEWYFHSDVPVFVRSH